MPLIACSTSSAADEQRGIASLRDRGISRRHSDRQCGNGPHRPLLAIALIHGARRHRTGARPNSKLWTGFDARLRQRTYAIAMLRYRIMLALMRGEFAEAERLIRAVDGAAASHGIAAHADQLSVQIFTLRREQGRLAELQPVVSAFLRRSDGCLGLAAGIGAGPSRGRPAGRRTRRVRADGDRRASPPFRATGDGCSAWSISARSAPRSAMPPGQQSCMS